MPKKNRFKFLEHTADVYIAAYGRDLAEAFENAALAMFESMTNTKDVKPIHEKTLEAEGLDKQSLLYNWLEKLLITFETENLLLSKFNIEKIEHTSFGLKLNAKAYGEPYDPARHKQKVGVKAVTYHRMEFNESPEKVTIKFILDI